MRTSRRLTLGAIVLALLVGACSSGGGSKPTIKIGSVAQTTTFIAGIRGETTALADAVPVLISSTGELGTINSSRALKREAGAEDVEGTVVFLASADSAFMTGQTLIVDGGSVFV